METHVPGGILGGSNQKAYGKASLFPYEVKTSGSKPRMHKLPAGGIQAQVQKREERG